MHEKRTVPTGIFKEIVFLNQTQYVVVNDFKSDNLKDFTWQCQCVLNSGQDFLPVVIDSFGGQVYTLLGMIDFLNSLDVRVITICESKAMSAGALLLSCGDERYVSTASTIMVHQVHDGFLGKDIEIQNKAKEVSRLNRKLFSLLDKNTEHESGYWKTLLKKNGYTDLFLSAVQCKKHNLATHIGIPYIETEVKVERSLVV